MKNKMQEKKEIEANHEKTNSIDGKKENDQTNERKRRKYSRK